MVLLMDRLFVVALLATFLVSFGEARKIADIYWNSTNPIFDISNTEHVISAKIGDRVSIKCPTPTDKQDYEYSYIYMVSEEEYKHCFLSKPRLVTACDNETLESSVNIVFRSFTPTPGGFEFQPGRNYYLISTSDGTLEGIDRKKDGLCSTKQMKIKFDILSNAHRPEVSPKFAARTFNKNGEEQQQIMYVIHNEDDDDDASTSASYLLTIIIAILTIIHL